MCLQSLSKEVQIKYKRRKIAYKIYRVITYSDGRKVFQTIFRGKSTPMPCNKWVDEKSRRDYPSYRDSIHITGVNPKSAQRSQGFHSFLGSSYPKGFHCYLNLKDATLEVNTMQQETQTAHPEGFSKSEIKVVKVYFCKPLAWGYERIRSTDGKGFVQSIQAPVVVAREIRINVKEKKEKHVPNK